MISNTVVSTKDDGVQFGFTLEISKNLCHGKVVSILEGGYDLNALMESTEMHVKALLEFN